MARPLRFIFREQRIELQHFSPTRTLLEWLREEKRALGTKEGCNEGDCGACTVVLVRLEGERLAYRPVNACILLLGQVDGAEIITVEDLASKGALHPVQQAMVDHHASQCGFCTPGIVMSLYAAGLGDNRPQDKAGVDEVLAGNLCRCTGYRPIIDAALASGQTNWSDDQADHRRQRLVELSNDQDMLIAGPDGVFAAPASLEGLHAFLATHPDAVIVAGSTDVGLWITKKLSQPKAILWLGRIAALRAISENAGHLHIGAMTSLEDARPALGRIDPDLHNLMTRFAAMQLRSTGTIGGNIANGSPIGDLAPALIALDTSLLLLGPTGVRNMPLERFFLAYGRQDRAAGEIVAALDIPHLLPNQVFRCFKISKRRDEDISTVMGAFRFTIESGRITEARIAYGGMAATPRRASATEAALTGVSLTDPHGWTEAIAHLQEDFQPISDMRASASYRLRVARAILGKALLECAAAPAATRLVPRGEGFHVL